MNISCQCPKEKKEIRNELKNDFFSPEKIHIVGRLHSSDVNSTYYITA